VVVQDDGDKPVVAAGGAGDETGAGLAGGACLDAVGFFQHPQQLVGVAQVDVLFAAAAVAPVDADLLAADDGCEDGVGEGVAGEYGEVVGRGIVAGGAEAVGIAEVGIGGAQVAGPQVHARYEGFGGAGEVLGDGDGGVVAGPQQQAGWYWPGRYARGFFFRTVLRRS